MRPRIGFLQPGEDADASVGQPVEPGGIADGQAGAGDMDRQALDRGLVDQGKF
jgi:hypothetical protein